MEAATRPRRAAAPRWRLAAVLAVALAARAPHATFPITGHHAWRQADTAAMARNYYENGYRFLEPQIDWRGDTSGRVESEFPAYAYAVALLYGAFGAHDAWGRLLAIACSLVAILALHALVRRLCGPGVAIWSAAFYAVAPLTAYFARAVMPESMMLMASVLAILWFEAWMRTGRASRAVLAAAATSLAALLKLPALYLGLPLLVLAWQRHGARALGRPALWAFAAAVLASVALWYAHAHALYRDTGLTFGIWGFGTDKWGNWAPLLTPKFYNDVFFKSVAERHLTWPGFGLCIAGLWVRRRSAGERVLDAWLVAVIAYFGIAAVGNQVHDYYQLPIVLPAAAFAGKAMHAVVVPGLRALAAGTGPTQALRRWGLVFLALCAAGVPVLSALRLAALHRKETRATPLFRLADSAERATEPEALVVMVDGGDPIWLYRAGRKGWHATPAELTPEFLAGRAARGARYLLGPRAAFRNAPARLETLLATHPVVVDAPDHFIVRLPSAAGAQRN